MPARPQTGSITVSAKTVVEEVQAPAGKLPEPPQRVLDVLSGRIDPEARNEMLASFFQMSWRSKERAEFLLKQFDDPTLKSLTIIQKITTAKSLMGLCTEGMRSMAVLLAESGQTGDPSLRALSKLVMLVQAQSEETEKAIGDKPRPGPTEGPSVT